MRNKILWLLTAIAVMLGGQALVAPAANAQTITAEAHATSTGAVDVNAAITAVSIVNTNAQGKIVGAWAQNPSKHWKPAKAKKVPFAKSYAAGASTCQPFRLKKGKWMPRTLKRRDGQLFQVQGGYRVKYAWSLFDVGANCQVRHRGYFSPKKHKWLGDCVNPKPTPNMPTYPPSMVEEVVQHTSIDYSLDLNWSASAWVYGLVSVDCGSSSATSSFSALGTTEGAVHVKVSASNRTEAEAKAKQQVVLNVKNSTTVKSDIMVSGEVSAEGSASASCTSNPPPVFEAPTVSVTPVACVNPGETRDVTITVSNPNGQDDTAKVTYRGTVLPTKPVAAHGQVTFTLANQAAGTYSGTALLVNADKSVAFTVTVEACPPEAAPVFVQFTEFNDLYKSLPDMPTTMDHSVTVDTPSGHSYSVTWTAVWGSFATPTKTGQDGVQVSSTYTAPSEVPPANPDQGLQAGYDKITVTVVDNVTGQQIVRSTAPFKIKEWPTTP